MGSGEETMSLIFGHMKLRIPLVHPKDVEETAECDPGALKYQA